jgi:hypothetical protein
MHYDLSSRVGRYRARKAGLDVPLQKPGVKSLGFWERVERVGDCLIWRGGINRDGYGMFHIDGKTIRAHRYAYEQANGPISTGMLLRHKCDTPACVNHLHLEIGTHRDNRRDTISRGRHAKGEAIASSVLTAEMVLEMRARYSRGVVTYQDLANEYGVSKDTAQKAIRKIYWRHI